MTTRYRSIRHAFAHFKECQLATLEGLQMRKSSAKSEIVRQQNICDDMVSACKDFGVGPNERGTPRLQNLLDGATPNELTKDHETALANALIDMVHWANGIRPGGYPGTEAAAALKAVGRSL